MIIDKQHDHLIRFCHRELKIDLRFVTQRTKSHPLSVNSWPSYCIGRCNIGVTREIWEPPVRLCDIDIYTENIHTIQYFCLIWSPPGSSPCLLVIQNHISNSNTFYYWGTMALICWFEIQFKYLTWYHLIRSGIKADKASGKMYLEG